MDKKKVILKRDPVLESCPSCGTANTIRRSHSRTTKEKLINHFTIYKTYRCKNCGWRGFLKTVTLSSSTFRVVAIYLLLLLLSGFITIQILKRVL